MIVRWLLLQEFTDGKTDGDRYHVPLSPPISLSSFDR